MRSRPSLRALPALVALLAVAAGCSTADGDLGSGPVPTTAPTTPTTPITPSDSSTPAPATALEVRVVLATDADPVACGRACDPATLEALDCAAPPSPTRPDLVLYACQGVPEVGAEPSAPAVRYALGPARVVGGVRSVRYGVPPGQSRYAIAIALGGTSRQQLATVTTALAGRQRQLALVLDGRVLSAPTVVAPITNGRAQIYGDLTEEAAQGLAAAIRAGG